MKSPWDITAGIDMVDVPWSRHGSRKFGLGCRIADRPIGGGVELKGWNRIARATIRNRQVLEPHVRRGFD